MKRVSNSILSILTIAAALGVPFTGHSTPKGGRNIILWIAVTDHRVYTTAHDRAVRKDVEKLVPGHDFIIANANTVVNLFNDDRVRQRLVSQIQNLHLQPGDKITHLFLQSHSGTNPQGTRTTLDHMGRYNEDGPDEKLQELLEPIREFTSPDLVVVQNGCFTFCGPADTVTERASKLMKFLNAPDGQIYGSLAAEAPGPIFPTFTALSTATVATALYLAAGQHITIPVVAGTLVTAAVTGATALSRWAGTKLPGLYNYGRILRFEKGELTEAPAVIKKENMNAIFNRDACAEALGENSGLVGVETVTTKPK